MKKIPSQKKKGKTRITSNFSAQNFLTASFSDPNTDLALLELPY